MRISDWSSDVCSSDLIGGDLGGARLGEHQFHFGKLFDRLLDLALHRQRLFEADRGHACRGERQILLIELGDELRAEQAKRRYRREEKRETTQDEWPRPSERLVEQRQITILALADQPHLLPGDTTANEECHQRGSQRERENEGGDKAIGRASGRERGGQYV